MADFNDAVSKIDFALASLEQRKNEFHLLKQETLSAQQADWTVNLNGVNCGAWRFLFLNISLVGSGVYYLRPNGSSNVSYSSPGSSSSGGGLAQLRTGESWNFIFLPFQSPTAEVRSLAIFPSLVSGQCQYTYEISYQNLTSFQLYHDSVFSGSYLSPGCQISLWGV